MITNNEWLEFLKTCKFNKKQRTELYQSGRNSAFCNAALLFSQEFPDLLKMWFDTKEDIILDDIQEMLNEKVFCYLFGSK